jgi:protein-tyrosine phosphatase
MKKLLFFSLLGFLFVYAVSAKPMTQDKPEKTYLVLDEDQMAKNPKQFRINAKIKASASGQFSEKTLKSVLPQMSGSIWVVDLRQESHGFIKGIPISWYGPGNKLNKGLSLANIEKKEEALLSTLKKQKTLTVHEITKKEAGSIVETKSIKMTFSQVESEKELAKRLHVEYLRIPVLDHHRPENSEVDFFVNFVQNLPKGAWLHFHCRGGIGRSSTFMMLYDILQNAKTESLESISERNIQLGGSNLFKHISEKNMLWKKDAALARGNFIVRFYEYAKSPEGYPRVSWQQWLQTH